MTDRLQYTIQVDNSDAAEPIMVGVFSSRPAAVAWMFKLADTRCEGCEIKKEYRPGFESVGISHPYGAQCELTIVLFQEAAAFLEEWNV